MRLPELQEKQQPPTPPSVFKVPLQTLFNTLLWLIIYTRWITCLKILNIRSFALIEKPRIHEHTSIVHFKSLTAEHKITFTPLQRLFQVSNQATCHKVLLVRSLVKFRLKPSTETFLLQQMMWKQPSGVKHCRVKLKRHFMTSVFSALQLIFIIKRSNERELLYSFTLIRVQEEALTFNFNKVYFQLEFNPAVSNYTKHPCVEFWL